MNVFTLLACLLCASAAHAADYKPARCASAVPYAGPALRSPPTAQELRVSGSIEGRLDEATAARLSDAFERALEASEAKSMTAAVAVAGKGMWSAERTPAGATAAPLHYWASAGKTLTALTVLRLVEAGRLSLDDPVGKFVEGVPNGAMITVAMLLDHTSGLFSANEDAVVRRNRKPLTLEETLRVLNRHGAMFCPGEQWRYTNSGYDLLGRIIEVVEGRLFAAAMTQRLLAPLGLGSLRILGPDDAAADVAPPAPSDPDQPGLDVRIPGAAGPLVARAEDVVRFWHAVMDDEVVSLATRERMVARLYPMFGSAPYYGQGVMVYDVPSTDAEKSVWIGHSGGAPGFRAILAYVARDRAFVAVALSGDGSAEASAQLLLTALRDARPPAAGAAYRGIR